MPKLKGDISNSLTVEDLSIIKHVLTDEMITIEEVRFDDLVNLGEEDFLKKTLKEFNAMVEIFSNLKISYQW